MNCIILSYMVIFICLFNILHTKALDTAVETEKPQLSDEEKDKALANLSEDCMQPREIGRCFAIFHRYAFNAETFACEEFIYGGCMGNKNNFETLEECERTCLKKDIELPTESAVPE